MTAALIEPGIALACVQCSAEKPHSILWCLIPVSRAGDVCIPTCNRQHMLDTLAELPATQFVDWDRLTRMYPELRSQILKRKSDKEDFRRVQHKNI